MAETNKAKEKRIKDYLKAKGHKEVDAKKADTPIELLNMVCDMHKVDRSKVYRILQGKTG